MWKGKQQYGARGQTHTPLPPRPLPSLPTPWPLSPLHLCHFPLYACAPCCLPSTICPLSAAPPCLCLHLTSCLPHPVLLPRACPAPLAPPITMPAPLIPYSLSQVGQRLWGQRAGFPPPHLVVSPALYLSCGSTPVIQPFWPGQVVSQFWLQPQVQR